MVIGRFIAGIAAVIRSSTSGQYLLLQRAADKDYGAGAWECVTGRVEQGEGYEEALHREIQEELGTVVKAEYILGTTHFYRGERNPEHELVGVVYLCSLDDPSSISIGEEHTEFRWLTANQARALLSSPDPTTQWARRVIEQAEKVRTLLPEELLAFQRESGFEFG
jgi:8-oxo-dGTP pyrophosphatase MutT (NUDIX family)